MLRPISRNGHVYSLIPDLYNPSADGPMKFALTGIGDTSTFSGFCSEHDKQLFECIEDELFACKPQQLFMLSYRAIAKEAYLKRKQAESLLPVETIRKIHQIGDDVEIELSPEAKLFNAASLRGSEEIERIKMEMDGILTSGNFMRLRSLIVPFKSRPPIASNFVFSPDLDFDGNPLQDFEDFSRDLDPLFVTLSPFAVGEYNGFLILSYIEGRGAAPLRFIDSLLQQNGLETAITWFLFVHTENFACEPSWYEGLSASDVKHINYAVRANVDFSAETQASLSEPLISMAEWRGDQPFWI